MYSRQTWWFVMANDWVSSTEVVELVIAVENYDNEVVFPSV